MSRVPLLGPSQLEMSSVVANRRMNRERDLRACRQELGCDPLAELRERGASNSVAWLDICCGTGRALVAAAKQAGPETAMAIDGIDLVDFFDPNPFTGTLELHACAFERWLPRKRYALVTCVHGLHYAGDKLAWRHHFQSMWGRLHPFDYE